MEGLKVHYDNTVRDSDGSIVQFYYGDDGLDPTKVGYLKKLDFFVDNFGSFTKKFKSMPQQTNEPIPTTSVSHTGSLVALVPFTLSFFFLSRDY